MSASVSVLDCAGSHELGPLGIDYGWWLECEFEGIHILTLFFLVVWIALLMDVLGNTAENYFCPALADISNSLKLSDGVSSPFPPLDQPVSPS
jgi:hypothetical protein